MLTLQIIVLWMLVGYIGVFLFFRFLSKHLEYPFFKKYGSLMFLLSIVGLWYLGLWISLKIQQAKNPSLFETTLRHIKKEFDT